MKDELRDALIQSISNTFGGLLGVDKIQFVDDDGSVHDEIHCDIKCSKHPKYKAVRKPRVKCDACLAMYNKKHPFPRIAK